MESGNHGEILSAEERVEAAHAADVVGLAAQACGFVGADLIERLGATAEIPRSTGCAGKADAELAGGRCRQPLLAQLTAGAAPFS